MYSSRMRTARSSSRPGGGLPQCMLGHTPQVWVWAWKPARHAGISPETCCKACWDTTPPPPPVNRMTDIQVKNSTHAVHDYLCRLDVSLFIRLRYFKLFFFFNYRKFYVLCFCVSSPCDDILFLFFRQKNIANLVNTVRKIALRRQ